MEPRKLTKHGLRGYDNLILIHRFRGWLWVKKKACLFWLAILSHHLNRWWSWNKVSKLKRWQKIFVLFGLRRDKKFDRWKSLTDTEIALKIYDKKFRPVKPYYRGRQYD